MAIWNKLHAKNLIAVLLKMDTGAYANVMSMEVFQKLFPGQNPKLTSTMFQMYGNRSIAAEGKCTVNIHYHSMKHQYKFYVTPRNDSPT